jgi:hypothetical protein
MTPGTILIECGASSLEISPLGIVLMSGGTMLQLTDTGIITTSPVTSMT